MHSKVHPSAPQLAPVHALNAAHAALHDPGRPPPGAQAGTAAPGQFRGSLFRPANAAARPSVQGRGRRSPPGARAKSAASQGDDGGFAIGDDEAGPWGAASAAPVDARGDDRDGSASDDERRQEYRLGAATFSVGSSGAAAAVEAVPVWAARAVAEGGVHALLLRLTQRLMHTIDATQTAPAANGMPLHQQILGDLAGAVRAAGDRPLDIGGWPGVCTVLREASRMRNDRPSQPAELVRRLNLMLPLLLHHLTRPRTPTQSAVLLARVGLACRSCPRTAPREVTHEP
jgi:hypothetical protein